MDIYKICVDHKFYCITKKSMESLGNNIFVKMINGETELIKDKICYNPNSRSFLVDIDNDSMKVIISLMRGYNINIDDRLKNKVAFDLELFEISTDILEEKSLLENMVGGTKVFLGDDIDNLNKYITELQKKVNDTDSFALMNAISTDPNVINHIKKNNDEASSEMSSIDSSSSLLDDNQNVNNIFNDESSKDTSSDDGQYSEIKLNDVTSQNVTENTSSIDTETKLTTSYRFINI